MQISKDNFYSVGQHSGMSTESLDRFWDALATHEGQAANSPFVTYLYYVGALIVIGAMTLFMGIAWESFGGLGIFMIAAIYALVFVKWGKASWDKPGLRVPAGLSITMAVCMPPLAIYGIEQFLGWWPTDEPEKYADFYRWVRSQWVFMEIGTIVAGIIALSYFRFPFIMAPIAFCAWYLSMDIAPFIFGKGSSFNLNLWITMIFGFVMMVIGFVLDRRADEDYGFWNYLFGGIAFWCCVGGLLFNESELARLLHEH